MCDVQLPLDALFESESIIKYVHDIIIDSNNGNDNRMPSANVAARNNSNSRRHQSNYDRNVSNSQIS